MAKTPAAIIDLVGAAEFADKVRASVGVVRVWKHRNRFPRHVWPEISAAFPELTTETLLEIEREQAA